MNIFKIFTDNSLQNFQPTMEQQNYIAQQNQNTFGNYQGYHNDNLLVQQQNTLANQNAALYQSILGQMSYQLKSPSRFQYFHGSLVYFGENAIYEILRYK